MLIRHKGACGAWGTYMSDMLLPRAVAQHLRNNEEDVDDATDAAVEYFTSLPGRLYEAVAVALWRKPFGIGVSPGNDR